MNYATIKTRDIANGPGVRVSLFVSGCTHRCKNCFNQEAWDFDDRLPLFLRDCTGRINPFHQGEGVPAFSCPEHGRCLHSGAFCKLRRFMTANGLFYAILPI